MTKHLKLVLAVFALAGLLASCKKDDDPQPAVEYRTEGSITGKITGVSKDASYTFNDDFSFTQFLPFDSYSIYQANSNGSFDFEISRSDFSSGGGAEISFSLASASSTTPTSPYVSISYQKEVDNKFIVFYISSGSPITTITGISFDANTGKISGNYSITGTASSTGKTATVTGSFNITAKKYIR